MKFQVLKVGIMMVTIFLFPFAVGAEFPDKPIQVLVGWSPGSQNDMIDWVVGYRAYPGWPGPLPPRHHPEA